MRIVKHVTANESLEIPAGHVVVVMPASQLGNQATTKGGKAFRPIESGFPRFGTVPCDNNPKIRVTASAIAVNPSDYAEADKKSQKSTITL